MPLIPEPRRKLTIWAALLGSLALFFLGSAFVPVEGQVKGFCLLEPARQWTLTERRVGSYESRTDDNLTGRILDYRLHQFDRPAVLDLGLGGDSMENDQVDAGQVVAQMSSSELELDLAERSTALEQARGRLAALRAGAKPAALTHAQLQARRAAAELEAMEIRYDRQKALFERGGISDEDWESTRANRDLLELDLQLAHAELAILESGDNPAEVQAAEETLRALEREHAAVSGMRDALAIHSPIAGILDMNPSTGVLASVSSVDSLVISVMLPQHRASELASGQALQALIPGLGEELFTGRLIRIEQEVLATERGPFIRAVGVIPNPEGMLEIGMQGRARISVGRSTLLKRFQRGLRALFFQELGP